MAATMRAQRFYKATREWAVEDVPIPESADHDTHDDALERMLPSYIGPALDFFDAFLTGRSPSADVPRAFAVSVSGCPVCGAKMKEAAPADQYASGLKSEDGTPAGAGTLIPTAKGLTGQAVQMAAFALMLSRLNLGREVVDRTGLTGRYDFTLRCAPTEAMRPVINGQMQPVSEEDAALPSIFTAVQEQLGLKLESTKGMIEGLVIDHIEQPSEN